MKIESNFIEGLLRDKYIGMTVYNDDGEPLTISELNYDPLTNHIFISDGIKKAKMSMEQNYDFEMSEIDKIKPNKEKIKGKKNR